MEREPAKRIGAHHTSDVKALLPYFFGSFDFVELCGLAGSCVLC